MSKEIGITESNGKKIVKELAILLADENILFLKTKNAGTTFYLNINFLNPKLVNSTLS